LTSHSLAQSTDVYIVFGHTGQVELLPPDAATRKPPPKTETLLAAQSTWNLTYDDVVQRNGIGFDGPQGAQARAAVSAVLGYVSSVITNTGTVDMEFLVSRTGATGSLATAGAYFYNSPAGFQSSWVQKHLTTGIDPATAYPYDAQGVVDFGYAWNFDYTGLTPPNRIDFFSVMLHEITHALGFSCLTVANGTSSIATNVRTYMDRAMETGTGKDLFANNGDGSFLGTASDLIGANGGIYLNMSEAVAAYGSKPKLYTPSQFSLGTSLSHYDFTVPNAVMHPSASFGLNRRTYTLVEIATLAGLGYSVQTPTPTPIPTASVSPSPSASPTPSPTISATPSPTPSPSLSPTESPSPSPSETPSPTPTETASPTPSPTETPVNDSIPLGDSVPVQLPPDRLLGVGIVIKNTGDSTWSADGEYYLAVIDDPNGVFTDSLLPILADKAVIPGDNYQFVTDVVTPSTPDQYSVTLQMYQANVGYFGDPVTINLNIEPPVNAVEGWQLYD